MNDKDREIIPFNKLCEAIKWKKNNCDSCKRYESESISEEQAKCKPAFYLDLSRHLGTMPLDMAKQIGCSYSYYTSNAELFDKCSKYLKNGL